MPVSLQNYPADKARQGEIILKRPWQKIVFLSGLCGALLLLVIALLVPALGHLEIRVAMRKPQVPQGLSRATAAMISSARIKTTIKTSKRIDRAVSIISVKVWAADAITETLPLSRVPRSRISYSSSSRA